MTISKQKNKYAITGLSDNEIVRMMTAFSTISRLLDLVHYDEDFHKKTAMKVKRNYEKLSDSFFNAIDYEFEGGSIESYILPSIETEINAFKMGIRTPSKNSES